MHVRELVDLAALLAVHGEALMYRKERIPAQGLEQYWTASKCRQDRWSRTLADYANRLREAQPAQRPLLWHEVRPVIEEVAVSEILTRVWSAVASAYDRQRAVREVEPLARSIFMGHLECRMRALNLIVYGCGLAANEAVALNKLRRRAERWSDLLLAFLFQQYEVTEFAFDAQRVRDFAADATYQAAPQAGTLAWELLLVSLRSAFQENLASFSPNAELHARVASGVLQCFDEDLSDAVGLLQPLWLLRLDAAANQTQHLIDSLLMEDDWLHTTGDDTSSRP